MNFKELLKKTIGRETVVIFWAAIGFRIVIYFFSVLIMMMHSQDTWDFSVANFIGGWNRWDAPHYINIANLGYSGAIEDGKHLFLVFFPLFPYLMRALGSIIGNTGLAGMIISTLTYAGGCVYLYRIGAKHAGKEGGRNLALLITVFPFSFFFGGIMTEGLFLLVSAATLYYVDEHKWWPAIFFGILATMTRMQGVLLGIPALVEAFVVYRPDKALRERVYDRLFRFAGRCASFSLMLLGAFYYLWVNYRTEGDPFRFMYYQKSHWGQGLGSPIDTIKYLFKYSFGDSWDLSARTALWLPQAVLAVIAILFLFSIKKIRPMYYAYGAVYVWLTFSATYLLSAGRYLACAIPMFLVLAIIGIKKKRVFGAIVILFAMLQMIYFIGFLLGKQIM